MKCRICTIYVFAQNHRLQSFSRLRATAPFAQGSQRNIAGTAYRGSSSETEPMFPERNISIGARQIGVDARRRMIERKQFRRAEGWIARRGDFSLPAFVCFFGAFFPQREESGVPKTEERTIDNSANPQICRRWEMRKKRIATAPCGASQ